MMVTAPRGYGFNQLKAEHPTTNHQMFLGCILQEIAACHQVPLYLVAGTAADLSYAGGRLDLQSYERTIRTERHRMACQILNACWLRWLEEAVFVPGLLPRTRSPYGDWRKQWFWPPFEHVDPLKEANAQKIRLANNTTTLADEWAKQNADWEVKMRQRAKEKALARELGVEEAAMLPGNQPQQGPANVFQPA